jgi:hypothetical protein
MTGATTAEILSSLAPNRPGIEMSTIPYNELAELLLETSMTVVADAPCRPEETADAIIDALSLTQLREHLLMHLTIDSWTVDLTIPGNSCSGH